MSEPSRHAGVNRASWEARGADRTLDGCRVTMFAEHDRYLQYVHDRELRFLLPRLPPEPRVLDVGCGTGRLALSLADRAKEIIGTDVAESMVQRAREAAATGAHRHLRVIRAPADQPLDVGSFDVVLLSGVLNYLEDADVAKALRAAADALRPGGLLYLRNVCACAHQHYREAAPDRPPTIYRTARRYVQFVEQTPGLVLQEERYLFAPVCASNLVYYYVLPRGLRDMPWATSVLGWWFRAAAATSEIRLAVLGRLYPVILRALRKGEAFRVLTATKR